VLSQFVKNIGHIPVFVRKFLVELNPKNGHQLKLYIPNRTGLILQKIPTPRVY
jgi:hypothetical protein